MKQPVRSQYHYTHIRTTPSYPHTPRIATCAYKLLYNGSTFECLQQGGRPAVENRHVPGFERGGDGWKGRDQRVLLLLLRFIPISGLLHGVCVLLCSRTHCFCAHTHTGIRARAKRCERYLAEIPEQMCVRSVRTRKECSVPHVILHILRILKEASY